MKPFWVSWWALGPFEYHGPWWWSGVRLDAVDKETGSICAAVVAKDSEHAKQIIAMAHDKRPSVEHIEWRFSNPREEDWSPFCERFSKADWMKWPFPEEK